MRVQNINNTTSNMNRTQKQSFTSKASVTQQLKDFLGEESSQALQGGIDKYIKRNGQTNSVVFSLVNKPDELAAMEAVVKQKRLFPSRVYEGKADMVFTGEQLSEKDALDLFTKALYTSRLVQE